MYTDLHLVQKNLTYPAFTFVKNKEDAGINYLSSSSSSCFYFTIPFIVLFFICFIYSLLPLLLSSDVLWCVSDTIDLEKVKRGQMTNQCSNERVITFKNHLAETVMRVFGDVSLPLPLSPLSLSLSSPPPSPLLLLSFTWGKWFWYVQVSWHPLSFDLASQSAEFVSQYLKNKEEGKDNLWIVKPWNLGKHFLSSFSFYSFLLWFFLFYFGGFLTVPFRKRQRDNN